MVHDEGCRCCSGSATAKPVDAAVGVAFLLADLLQYSSQSSGLCSSLHGD